MQDFFESLINSNLWHDPFVLKRHEFLKHKGTVDTHVYCILSGSVKLCIQDEATEHILRFGYDGNIISALDSYLTGAPSPIYIEALKRTVVKKMPKEHFESFLISSDEYLHQWRAILEQLLLQQLEREQDILTASPLERYQRVLARSPQLFQHIPHKYIAAYLRMTPETLSRIKKY